jgi:hypothetical protein
LQYTVLWYLQRTKEDIRRLYQDRVYRKLNTPLRGENCCHSKKKKKKKKKERERSWLAMYYTNICFAMDVLQRQILVVRSFSNWLMSVSVSTHGI